MVCLNVLVHTVSGDVYIYAFEYAVRVCVCGRWSYIVSVNMYRHFSVKKTTKTPTNVECQQGVSEIMAETPSWDTQKHIRIQTCQAARRTTDDARWK